MRILLVGEYSGVHTTLAKTLREQGYSVFTISDGDGFKDFPADIILNNQNKIRISGLQVLLDWLGIKGLIDYFKIRKKLKKNVSDFDVIQFINTAPISAYSSFSNYWLVRDLIKSSSNARVFLCALGDDYAWVKNGISNRPNNSYFDRISWSNIKSYLYSLKYVYGVGYKSLNNYIISKSVAIIPGLEDYRVVYDNHPKISPIIRLPLDNDIYKDALELYRKRDSLKKNNKIIFHGWQLGSEIRKGNNILDSAVKKSIEQLSKKSIHVSYEVVKSLPYAEYVKRFDEADIFLDQVYSLDRGYNAILGMAKGKVVVSGFERELTSDGECDIGLNASTDVNALSDKITAILLNTEYMTNIKVKALKYVIEHHNPDDIAEQYLMLWRRTQES